MFTLYLDVWTQHVSSPPGFGGHRWGSGPMAEGQHGHRAEVLRDRCAASSPHVSETVVLLYEPSVFNLKHQLRLISETLAAAAGSSYGCYFVPAFSGLYAPYWEPSARG